LLYFLCSRFAAPHWTCHICSASLNPLHLQHLAESAAFACGFQTRCTCSNSLDQLHQCSESAAGFFKGVAYNPILGFTLVNLKKYVKKQNLFFSLREYNDPKNLSQDWLFKNLA